MRNKIFALLPALVAIGLFPQHVRAQAPEEKFRLVFPGYKSVRLLNPVFSHDTHPDDSFLPDAGVPGSAGTTDLGGLQHFCAAGVGYQPRLSDSVSFNIDAGFLLGGKRDRRKNANDTRPAGEESAVYSQARYGLFASAGASYYFKRLWIGVEAQLASVFVESGWDRYDSDERQVRKARHRFSAGPKVGFLWKDGFGYPSRFGIECTVQFNQFVTFGAQAVINF